MGERRTPRAPEQAQFRGGPPLPQRRIRPEQCRIGAHPRQPGGRLVEPDRERGQRPPVRGAVAVRRTEDDDGARVRRRPRHHVVGPLRGSGPSEPPGRPQRERPVEAGGDPGVGHGVDVPAQQGLRLRIEDGTRRHARPHRGLQLGRQRGSGGGAPPPALAVGGRDRSLIGGPDRQGGEPCEGERSRGRGGRGVVEVIGEPAAEAGIDRTPPHPAGRHPARGGHGPHPARARAGNGGPESLAVEEEVQRAPSNWAPDARCMWWSLRARRLPRGRGPPLDRVHRPEHCLITQPSPWGEGCHAGEAAEST